MHVLAVYTPPLVVLELFCSCFPALCAWRNRTNVSLGASDRGLSPRKKAYPPYFARFPSLFLPVKKLKIACRRLLPGRLMRELKKTPFTSICVCRPIKSLSHVLRTPNPLFCSCLSTLNAISRRRFRCGSGHSHIVRNFCGGRSRRGHHHVEHRPPSEAESVSIVLDLVQSCSNVFEI